MYTRISLLVVALAFLIGAPSLLAWTNSVQSPPGGNVAAPVHTGPATQYKPGNLAVDIGLAFSQFRSNQYCDINGLNCVSTLGGGTTLPNCSNGQVVVAQNGNWVCRALNSGTSVYSCPVVLEGSYISGEGDVISSACAGQLQLNANCNYRYVAANNGNTRSSSRSCNNVGKLVP